jgi:hypothetical protein
MLHVIIGIIIIGILFFLVIKAIGNIIKGLLLLFLVFVFYYFLSRFREPELGLTSIGSFLKIPIEKLRNLAYNLEIVSVSFSKEGRLVIIVRNNGFLPLTNFGVKIDGKEVRTLGSTTILFPRQLAMLEVEWSGKFSKIEVITRETNAIYISPL